MASHIERRKFLATLGGACAWPLAARAQEAAVRRVGVLMNLAESDAEGQARIAAFRLVKLKPDVIFAAASSSLATPSARGIWLEATYAINAHRSDRSGGNVCRRSCQPSHSNAVVRGH
jgi:hypothetical protein